MARWRMNADLLADHRLFLMLLAAAAGLRVLVMVGYRPALLYYGDSYAYLGHAVSLEPLWGFQPSGYPLFLALLRPARSLAVVTAVQHLLGMTTGVLIYALLRRRRIPAWGATAATVPVLLGGAFLQLEHSILSDTLFIFCVVAAVTTAMWSPRPTPGQAVATGLLLAAAALTRTIAIPMIVVVVVLLVRRAGRRQITALAVAAVVPLVGYAGWYADHYGRFALAGGDGIALWARTMTFADCKVIKPPPREAPLCPNGSHQDAASEYIWATDSPINQMSGDHGKNELARAFARRAILAQPGDYVRAVAHDTMLAFSWPPAAHPKRVGSGFRFPADGPWPFDGRPHARQAVRDFDPGARKVRVDRPVAGVLIGYQNIAHMPGPVLGALLLLALAGAAPARWLRVRRPTLGAGLARRSPMPGVLALYLLVAPVAVLDFGHRYVLPVVPLACLAAALAIADLRATLRPAGPGPATRNPARPTPAPPGPDPAPPDQPEPVGDSAVNR
jgi:hypothetical protein